MGAQGRGQTVLGIWSRKESYRFRQATENVYSLPSFTKMDGVRENLFQCSQYVLTYISGSPNICAITDLLWLLVAWNATFCLPSLTRDRKLEPEVKFCPIK